MSRIAHVDTETTGLDPRWHRPWEVAVVRDDGATFAAMWRPNFDVLRNADPEALEVGGFADRAPQVHDQAVEHTAALRVAELLTDCVIVGSKPSFDTAMLEAWLRSWGVEATWHHRPVCVATMAYGWLARESMLDHKVDHDLTLPWRSDDLSLACGVNPADYDRHTALGDVLWTKAWFEKLTGGAA